EADHRHAVERLIARFAEDGGTAPLEGRRRSDLFDAAFAGAPAALSDEAALFALQRGEQTAPAAYAAALDDPVVDPESRSMISTVILPRQRDHLPVIDRLLHS